MDGGLGTGDGLGEGLGGEEEEETIANYLF